MVTAEEQQLKMKMKADRQRLAAIQEERSSMCNVLFKYTTPNAGSWNGKWSGEGHRYEKVIRMKKTNAASLKDYYHYNFGDGWSAGIYVSRITYAQARESKRATKGFCGYDWMITSILKNGKIIDSGVNQ